MLPTFFVNGLDCGLRGLISFFFQLLPGFFLEKNEKEGWCERGIETIREFLDDIDQFYRIRRGHMLAF